MDNALDNGMDNCPDCGKDRTLVGYRHNCISKAAGEIISVETAAPKTASGQSTYQYRDPVKRRAQVAEAMRRYRAKRKP